LLNYSIKINNWNLICMCSDLKYNIVAYLCLSNSTMQ